MSSPAYRCSAASLQAGESAVGTASTVRRFLLVEEPGPWGVDAVSDSRLPAEVKAHLVRLRDRERIRPLLVRRPTRPPVADGVHVFLSDTRAGTLTGTVLPHASAICDLDPASLPPVQGPLFLACTHGRHDACCAELGRPLARALAEVEPLAAWEVSHIGGDRFAPNVLVLPHGLYYGRLPPEEAPGFVDAHVAGRIDLEHLRGRTTLSFPAQAAEVALRRSLDEDRVGAVRVLRSDADGEDRVVELAVGPRRFLARVRPVRRPAARLTCRAAAPSVAVTHDVVELRPLGGGSESPRVPAPRD